MIGSPSTPLVVTVRPTRSSLGAVEAASPTIEPVLVGPPHLETHGLPLIEASEAIDMDDHAVDAVRAKPDSSLVRAVDAVADGKR